MGFKHTVTRDSFLSCAQEISQSRRFRVNENVLMYRATFVVNYLYNNFNNLQFSETEWDHLIRIPFIPASNINDSPHSEITYKEFGRVECLKSLCLPKYKNIAWTQVAFLSESATPSENSPIMGKENFGKPSAEQILDHLREVAEKIPKSSLWKKSKHVDLPSILDEIYDALNSACEGEDPELEERDFIPGELIFLNIDPNDPDDDPYDVKNWVAANELIINVSKAEKGFVKASLSKYESLLKTAGSGKVIVPRVTPNFDDNVDGTLIIPQSMVVLDKLNQFLLDESRFPLNDVTFIVRNEEIKASRIVLAAASDFFFKMFCKNYRESNPIEPVKANGCDIDPKSFRIFLRWLYGEPLEEILGIQNFESDSDDDDCNDEATNLESNEYSEDLIDLLKDLLKASDYYGANQLKVKIEAELQNYVKLMNVKDVRELADECQAPHLRNFCEEFMKLNSDFL